ncbi:hypothetical protein FQN60_011248 [Etheostoma spectabile]|uniref:Ig-like domain-containing protein n=1 Tax=Etheostoma spectabile TaxID=54343 RepID=A0A5J5DRA6_9PERO|nr:hypothetical protein FQN60_011248 [Etheostoma spectabile]
MPQLNKQTNPLPLDTRLRRGDLLWLSGRILSDIVAPVNKRKAPEARGAALFVRGLKVSRTVASLAPALKKGSWEWGGAGSAAQPFSPFWFTAEPQDTLAIRGNSALLNCSAHSDAATPARIEWKKDGTFMVSDERRNILPDGSLFFTHVVHSKHNKPDEGTYQCVATIDNLGSISSQTARLSVAAAGEKCRLGVSWVETFTVHVSILAVVHTETPTQSRTCHSQHPFISQRPSRRLFPPTSSFLPRKMLHFLLAPSSSYLIFPRAPLAGLEYKQSNAADSIYRCAANMLR